MESRERLAWNTGGGVLQLVETPLMLKRKEDEVEDDKKTKRGRVLLVFPTLNNG